MKWISRFGALLTVIVVLSVAVLLVVNPFAATDSSYQSIQIDALEDGEQGDSVPYEELSAEQREEFQQYLGGRPHDLTSRPALAAYAGETIRYEGEHYRVLVAVA